MTPSSLFGPGSSGSTSSIDDLVQAGSNFPQQPLSSGGSTARRIFGSLLGGAANVFMPGVGGVISNLIGGGGGANSLLSSGGSNLQQLLQTQQQLATETETFTLESTILKDRHDAAMTAIQNAKTS